MTLETWIAFVLASAVLLASPGPTVLLVVSYALQQGRRAIAPAVAGVALGDLVAMTVSMIGLGALLLTSAELYNVLRWIGAAYLVYLGLKMLRSQPEDWSGSSAEAPRSARQMAQTTFLVTVLNPKGIVFFVAFVPQFLNPSAAYAPQALAMIATFVGLASLNAAIYGGLAVKARGALTSRAVRSGLDRVGGAMLIGAGVYTATAGSRS
ncbi:MAG: LysE family translocator [Pseudomonadota bacterium]